MEPYILKLTTDLSDRDLCVLFFPLRLGLMTSVAVHIDVGRRRAAASTSTVLVRSASETRL